MSECLALDPELILFDLDDTLCDSHLAVTRRLRYAFELAADAAGLSEGLDFEAMVRSAVDRDQMRLDDLPDVLARFGITAPVAVEAARGWIEGNRLHGLEYFHDAIETIEAVRFAGAGRRVGIITNGPAWIQRPKVELLGVADHVDFVIISGEFGVHKPEPAIFREGLRLGRAQAEQTVFIGDSIENDVGGAHAVGMTSIWMNRNLLWPDELPPPHHIAADLAEVRRLLT